MYNKKLIKLLDELIDRSDKLMEDADKKGDSTLFHYYVGQKHLAEEIKVYLPK